MNIDSALKEGRKILKGGSAADILLCKILQKPKEYLIINSDTDIDDELYKEYIFFVRRHERGEPVSYLTGIKEFFGFDFYVNKNVLIPRPETEHIVEKIIELAGGFDKNETMTILDVGTGSGNIAVSLAKSLNNAQITAVDVSEEALEVAKMNIKQHCVEDRISVFRSDLLSDVKGEFDLIVANLPYIGTKENNYIAREVETFEPKVALFGGEDGLELYEKLFAKIQQKKCLKHYMLGEIGFSQKKSVEKLIQKYFAGMQYAIFKDLAGFDRYFVVNYLSKIHQYD